MDRQTPFGGYQFRANYGPAGVPAQPPLSPHEHQARALSVLKALEPKKVVGHGKVRLGRDFDGGYIMVDDFDRIDAALSFGIADDASWDLDIAKRNIPVHQFDHSIERGPADHPLLTFHRMAVAAADTAEALSLESIAERYLAGCTRAIMKIDIEGHEWGVFQAASAATLDRFTQIVCEFHSLQHISERGYTETFRAVLDKLRSHFEVVHVHGNNALPLVNVANLAVPALLEVTFASRKHYQFAETDEVFPTAIDQPNIPDRPDMRLGCFKF